MAKGSSCDSKDSVVGNPGHGNQHRFIDSPPPTSVEKPASSQEQSVPDHAGKENKY